MPPLIYLVRHAEGQHNVNDASWIRDALLTDTGKAQCLELRDKFPLHNTIQVVMSSPLRRAIQTTALSFGPTLMRDDVKLLLIPLAQEVSAKTCDVGFPKDLLKQELPKMLEGHDVGFDLEKVDFSLVVDGWNSKQNFWAPQREAVQKRAAALRSFLFEQTARHILLVTHGAFLHYLTEDWTGDDPKRGTAYLNCEVRQFTFTSGSNVEDAHIEETEESKTKRGPRVPENDPAVIEEMQSIG